MKCTFTNVFGVDGHDWVLVHTEMDMRRDYARRPTDLLWACPCGEFKWTSYAEWERGREIPPQGAYQSPEALDPAASHKRPYEASP